MDPLLPPLAQHARRLTITLGLIGALSTIAPACGGPANYARPDMEPLDEGRAVLVIQNAMVEHGAKPGPAKQVGVNDKPLTVDVTVAGTPYGVAFITEQEAVDLGQALPPRHRSNTLRLIRPNPDDIILLLYQDTYEYDVSDEHTVTAQTVELKLGKDIADFVLRVVKADEVR